MKNFIKSFLIIFLLIIVYSCSKDTEGSNDSDSTVEKIDELDEDTVIITSESNNLLTDIDENKLVFSSSNNQINNLVVGSIMASDIHSNAPNGYLREVVSINSSGGNVTVNTIQASIADAIKNVNFTYSYSIGDENIIDIDSSGVDITNKRIAYSSNKLNTERPISITVPFKGFELYTNTEGEGKITLDGNLTMTFDIDFDLNIEDNSVTDFKFIQKINATADATLKGSIENLPTIHEQKTLWVMPLAPITLPIFGIPVPLAKQWIVIVMGVDGKISAGFTVGTKNDFTLNAGVTYNKSSGWSIVSDVSNDYTPSTGEIFATGEIEGWVQARYEVRPYGLSSARIFIANSTGPKLLGKISTSNSGLLNLELEWCVESNIKAQMQIFDKTIIDYDQSIYNQCFNIAKWSNNAEQEFNYAGNWYFKFFIEDYASPGNFILHEEAQFVFDETGNSVSILYSFTGANGGVTKYEPMTTQTYALNYVASESKLYLNDSNGGVMIHIVNSINDTVFYGTNPFTSSYISELYRQ